MSTPKRLFFIASLVQGEVAGKVLSLQQDMCRQFKSCHSLKSPPHVTLIPPFRMDASRTPDLHVLVTYPPVSIQIAMWGVDHFDDRVIYINVGPDSHLSRWRDELFEKLNQAAIPMNKAANFRPHITIGTRLSPGQFAQAWPFFRDARLPGSTLLSEPRLLCHDGKRWVLDV